MTLEEILIQIFYRTAAVYNFKKMPRQVEVESVVKKLAETMRAMNLTIVSNNLLKGKSNDS